MFPQDYFNQNPMLVYAIAAGVVWSLIWKGLALWKAARLSQKGWFVALILLNTLGLLEIFYLFVFSKQKEQAANF